MTADTTPIAPSSTVSPSPTPVPGTTTGTTEFTGELLCPGPAAEPREPVVKAAISGGPGVRGVVGSYTLATCSTGMTADKVAEEPTEPLDARPGDTIDVTVEPGWRIVKWSAFDRATRGEGVNVWPEVATPDGPRSISANLPARAGDSIYGFELTLMTDDRRAMGTYPVLFLVRVAR